MGKDREKGDRWWRNATHWKAFIYGLIVLLAALTHAHWPQRLLLDWPTVALLSAGVLVLFLPQIISALPYVKKVKWRDTEIELVDRTNELTEDLEKIEKEPVSRLTTSGTKRVREDRARDLDFESRILELSATDKESALLRLAIEIEKELIALHQAMGLELRRPTWRDLVADLAKKEVLSASMATALLEFRDIRNQLIHSGFGGPVRESILIRGVDNGLKLLRLLKSTPR